MKVVSIFSKDYRNFSYLIYSQTKEVVCCVDPYDAQHIIDQLQKLELNLKYILNTHQHFDHVKGNAFLKEKTGAKVVDLENEKELKLDDRHSLIFKESSGHTDRDFCILGMKEKHKKFIISGDTLFCGGVGNCKSGDPVKLYEVIENFINSLSDDLILYPGHEYAENNLLFVLSIDPNNLKAKEMLKIVQQKSGDNFEFTNLGQERGFNPFLRPDKLEKSEKYSNKEIFLELRALRDKW